MGCCSSSDKDDDLRRLDYNEPDPEDLKKPILQSEDNESPEPNTRRRGSSRLFDDALSPPQPTTHIVKRGFLTKEGARRKNWKKRYFILSAGVLSYYEKELEIYPYASVFKGHISLKDSEVSTFIGKDLKLRLTIQKGEKDDAGKTFLQMKGTNDDETNEWAKAVVTELDKTKGSTSRDPSKEEGEMQDVTAEPQLQQRLTNEERKLKAMRMSFSNLKAGVKKSGWGKKKGSLRKNWKNRYFVLADGWLSYYAKGPPHVSDRKGQLPMDGCRIEVVDTKGIKIVSPIQDRTLHVEFEEELDEWRDALENAVDLIGSVRVMRFGK